jgi:hypothetical protein
LDSEKRFTDSSYRNLKRAGNTIGVQHEFLNADDTKQAESKSGFVADLALDFDGVMLFSRSIREINVNFGIYKRYPTL